MDGEVTLIIILVAISNTLVWGYIFYELWRAYKRY